MAMEVIQTVNGAHEDALAGIAYNPINKQVYTCAEGDKAIKVSWKSCRCAAAAASTQQYTALQRLLAGIRFMCKAGLGRCVVRHAAVTPNWSLHGS